VPAGYLFGKRSTAGDKPPPYGPFKAQPQEPLSTPQRRAPCARITFMSRLSAFIGVPLLVFAPVWAQEAPNNIEIVFDASGSMRTSTSRFTSYAKKVEIAKDELKRFIMNLPESNVRLALRVFGTRQQLVCQDIQLMRSLAPIDKRELLAVIDPWSPPPTAVHR